MTKQPTIEKGSYVFFVEDPKKPTPRLMRVTDVRNGQVRGRLEHDPHINPCGVECEESAVIAVLGKEPHPGAVYGRDLSFLYRRTRDVPGLGDVHLFTSVDQETGAQFQTAVKSVCRLLKEHGLSFLLHSDIVWQVVSRHTAGKTAGMYYMGKRNQDGEWVKLPRISVTLDDEARRVSSIPDYAYVLSHELGHALHLQYVWGFPKLYEEWISMYTQTVRPVRVEASRVTGLYSRWLSDRTTLSAFKSTLDEEDQEVLKVILGEIRRTSRLSPRDLDILTQSEDAEAHIKAVWPNSSVYLSKLSPLVTQYALKNYHELFAETFSFFLLDKKLPRALESLMEKTIRRVASKS